MGSAVRLVAQYSYVEERASRDPRPLPSLTEPPAPCQAAATVRYGRRAAMLSSSVAQRGRSRPQSAVPACTKSRSMATLAGAEAGALKMRMAGGTVGRAAGRARCARRGPASSRSAASGRSSARAGARLRCRRRYAGPSPDAPARRPPARRAHAVDRARVVRLAQVDLNLGSPSGRSGIACRPRLRGRRARAARRRSHAAGRPGAGRGSRCR